MPQRRQTTFDRRVPFTRADARAAGLTDHNLRAAGYRRLFHDTYVCASLDVTVEMRAAAALRVVTDGAHVSHRTAAALWKLWIPEDPDVHVSVPPGRPRTKRRGIRAHVAARTAHVVTYRGVRTSTPTQTFLDLAASLDLVALVTLGDSIVHRGHATPDDLMTSARQFAGRGARRARRAAALVRAGVDSPMETKLRMLVVLAGMPEPVVNHTLYAEDGRWKIRFDLSYPELKIAIEYDGRQHAESREQWQRDIHRREELDGLGWRLVIVDAAGIYTDPAGTLTRILDVLRERGAAKGVRVRGDEWRRHFPGRPTAA